MSEGVEEAPVASHQPVSPAPAHSSTTTLILFLFAPLLSSHLLPVLKLNMVFFLIGTSAHLNEGVFSVLGHWFPSRGVT